MRTSEIAKAAGIAVNTVRLYEKLGYLPPVPRAANGYRQFDTIHLHHIRLVRQTMKMTWLGGQFRHDLLDMLVMAAQEEIQGAESIARRTRDQLHTDKHRAEDAVVILERWLSGNAAAPQHLKMRIGEAADFLGVSSDVLRGWERDGLVTIARQANGYRVYRAADIDQLIVIRALRQARYSTLSILRMFHQLDNGEIDSLSAALDSPPPEENLIYATDQWLTTLTEMIAAAEAVLGLLEEIQTLH